MPAYRRCSTPSDEESKNALAVRHLGIITARVLHWWRFLPPSTQRYYDVEDMVGDVILHVIRVRNRYDPDTAMESTFVHHIADNKCLSILSHYRTRKLSACETISIDDPLPNTSNNRASTHSLLTRITAPAGAISPHYQEALEAVERTIQSASDAVCDLLEIILEGRVLRTTPNALKICLEREHTIVADLKRTMQHCGATVADLELVLRYAHQ